jgi:hypothetical protein
LKMTGMQQSASLTVAAASHTARWAVARLLSLEWSSVRTLQRQLVWIPGVHLFLPLHRHPAPFSTAAAQLFSQPPAGAVVFRGSLLPFAQLGGGRQGGNENVTSIWCRVRVSWGCCVMEPGAGCCGGAPQQVTSQVRCGPQSIKLSFLWISVPRAADRGVLISRSTVCVMYVQQCVGSLLCPRLGCWWRCSAMPTPGGGEGMLWLPTVIPASITVHSAN